jgi:hypothetical protein
LRITIQDMRERPGIQTGRSREATASEIEALRELARQQAPENSGVEWESKLIGGAPK